MRCAATALFKHAPGPHSYRLARQSWQGLLGLGAQVHVAQGLAPHHMRLQGGCAGRVATWASGWAMQQRPVLCRRTSRPQEWQAGARDRLKRPAPGRECKHIACMRGGQAFNAVWNITTLRARDRSALSRRSASTVCPRPKASWASASPASPGALSQLAFEVLVGAGSGARRAAVHAPASMRALHAKWGTKPQTGSSSAAGAAGRAGAPVGTKMVAASRPDSWLQQGRQGVSCQAGQQHLCHQSMQSCSTSGYCQQYLCGRPPVQPRRADCLEEGHGRRLARERC